MLTVVSQNSTLAWQAEQTQPRGGNHMDRKTVEKLEEKIEEAISEAIVKMGLKKLPLLPNGRTPHMMAKAATAVYEAVASNYAGDED